jgi:PelA/Pel-15E family pectate lyase
MNPRKLFKVLAVTITIAASGSLRAASPLPELLKKPDAWFSTPEARQYGSNIVSFQSELGGWPKNTDTVSKPYTGNKQDLHPTFDNGATTDELRFLAMLISGAEGDRYKEPFFRGYSYILSAQYPNGGWPQSFPPGNQYHRHITFNDNAMVRLMLFLRESATSPDYAFVDPNLREKALAAFERGVDCMLKCQVRVEGKLTAWCAQHDEKTLDPRPARAYELVSLSGSESVGIVRLLMSLKEPKKEVREAIEAACAWLDSVKLTGIRIVMEKDGKAPKGTNKVVVKDPGANPLWARFYEIGTNKPFFCDRDGVKKYSIAEIGYERRNGYAWYGEWPKALLEKELPAWRERVRADQK